MTPRTPLSRRDRPSKPALSRDAIVDAAMRVLERDGVAKVTIRQVAAELDTGPASLYVYVTNVTVLQALIADRLIADLDLNWDGVEKWRPRLHRLLGDYVELLAQRGELARAVMFVWPDGPHYLDLINLLVRLLQAAGADDRSVAWGIDLLLQHASTTAAEWAERVSATSQDLDDLAETLSTADAERYPALAAFATETFTAGGHDERRRWALDILINGITATKR